MSFRRCVRESERRDPHPVYRAFMDHDVSKTFSRDEVRAEVIPVYMGLIKQIDDQMGVLFRFMEEHGLFDNTMIVFTADHGDYLGDHWLGDKDFFHDASVKVPLIIYDPSPAADQARGSVCDEMVEAIDLAPTFSGNRRRRSGAAIAPARRPLAAAVAARRAAGGVAVIYHQRIRLRDDAGLGEAWAKAARRAFVHDRR